MTKSYWLINSSRTEVKRFIKNEKSIDEVFEYMFIDTGKIVGEPNFGEEKVRRIKRWIKENQIDTNLYKIAYSDSFHDLPLLEFADLPTAVNPDKKLKEISSNRGWKIIERSR